MIGRITRVLSNDYTVRYDDGNEDVCKARGVFRNKKISPLVGDIVEVDNNKKIITDIHKRKNELVRPPVANIDIALIVTSATEPTFSSNLLDKMIDIIEYNNITPVICISKYDLLDNTEEMDKIIEYYKKIGYKVLINTQIEDIKKIFKDNVTILTGQTGVGKSSLINKLEESMNLKTNEISKALGRGKHTTRHTELLNTCEGWVADTPGFSSLDFKMVHITKSDIRDNFIEFQAIRELCKYQDCMHLNDDGCEIKEEVEKGNIISSRYKNYIKFITDKE